MTAFRLIDKFVLWGFFLCVLVVVGQNLACAESYRIMEIRVEGANRVNETHIREAIQVQPGQDLSRGEVQLQVRADVKKVATLDGVQDVLVATEPTGEGIRLIFEIQEYPLISNLEFSGNRKYDDDRLRRELGFTKRTGIFKTEQVKVFYSPLQEKFYLKKLEEIYEEKGFSRTEITTDVQQDPSDDTVILSFEIKEGKKLGIVGNRFVGNDSFTAKKLVKEAKIKTKKPWWHLFAKQLNQAEIDADIQRLTRYYEDHGYYRVKITQAESEEVKKGRAVRVVFEIEEGDVYSIGETSVAGNRIFSSTEVTQNCYTATGATFNRTELEKDAFAIGDLYRSQGFIYTMVQPRLIPRDDENLLDVSWEIGESNRFRLGEIHPEGVVELEDKSVETVPLKTKDHVILREFEIDKGDVLDWSRVRRSERNLLNLGYFKKMEGVYPARLKFGVQPEVIPDVTDVLDLHIRLEEEPTGMITFGGGFSTASGASVFMGIQERNLFGYGWKGSLNATIGTQRQAYQLSFTEPYLFGSDYSLTLDVYRRFQDAYGGREFDDTRTGGAIRLGKELYEDLYGTVRYKFERVEIGDIDQSGTRVTSRPEVYQEDTSTTSSLTFGLAHDTRDYVLNPSKGHRYSGTIEFAGLGGDTEFWKAIGNASWYQLMAKKLIFAFDVEAGWAGPFGNTDMLPLHERFFMGGANSVRGFEESGVGPRDRFIVQRRLNDGTWYDDQDDVAVGGEVEIQTRAELRYMITDQIQGVIFTDSGSVWEEVEDVDLSEFRLSAGVGLRVNLPIGAAIRLDLGYPIIKEDWDDTRVFHFGFNQSF